MLSLSRRRMLRLAGATALGLAMKGPSRLAAQSSLPAGSLSSRRRFSFLHTYEATGEYWRGLNKAGLIRPWTGVRLVNSPFGSDDRRFNTVARIGGDLHGILSRRKCPFVVDRVAGGAPYLAYDFDVKLIAAYADLLGDAFLGGQVHETVCNTHNDWERIVKADPKFATEPVNPDQLRSYFTQDSAPKWLEYGTVDDYAGQRRPTTDWWPEITRSLRRQAARSGNHWSYAEGSAHGLLTWHRFYRFGATSCFAEVGPWASTYTQLMIASLRGTARAAGKPWGVFFAPWGPGGCTSFIPEKDWSWQCPHKSFEASGWPIGPQMGPSTALQRRIFFHAYLAGAHTLHEEWGAEGNLTNWQQGTVSSYGRVTRDLLDFVEKYPDVGEPYTPIAILAPADGANAEHWKRLQERLFQPSSAERLNASRPGTSVQEMNCYPPCVVPEVFDVVPGDAPAEVLRQYQQVILFAPTGTGDVDGQADRIIETAAKLSPVQRSTHLPMQINHRASDDAWIVAIYNPWGAKRGDVDSVGSILDGVCTVKDVLRLNSPVASVRTLHAWPESSVAWVDGEQIHVAVGPGGTLILEIRS